MSAEKYCSISEKHELSVRAKYWIETSICCRKQKRGEENQTVRLDFDVHKDRL